MQDLCIKITGFQLLEHRPMIYCNVQVSMFHIIRQCRIIDKRGNFRQRFGKLVSPYDEHPPRGDFVDDSYIVFIPVMKISIKGE